MNRKKINPPVNFNMCSTELGELIDTAIKDNFVITENSVLYFLLLDTVIGLQKRKEKSL